MHGITVDVITAAFERNAALDAEVRDLGSGKAAIEARARVGLGMVRRGETFYLITQQDS